MNEPCFHNHTAPWLAEELLEVDGFKLIYQIERYAEGAIVMVIFPQGRKQPLSELLKEGRAIRLPLKWRAGNGVALEIEAAVGMPL